MMIIDHYATSIIAHYHALNMAAIFVGCLLREPHSHTASLNHPDL